MRERFAEAGRWGLRTLDASHRWRTLLGKGRDPFRVAEPMHFCGSLTPDQARRLFARSVSMVEIETSSYCNRACWFCPNATYDRRSQKHYMDLALYRRILDDLADIRYCQKTSFSRYNEPLASHQIVDRIREARLAIPDALLHLNTNGDFLTREYLDELYAAGLRSMNIQVYLRDGEAYDQGRVRSLMLTKIAKLGTRHRIVKDVPGQRLEARLGYRDMSLRIYGRNFAENGCDRGGTVTIGDAYVRRSPCASPFYHAYIDYDGSMLPCCNLRSDIPSHADAVLGRLTPESSLFDVYANETAASWRRSVVGYQPKTGLCTSCAFVPFPATWQRKRTQERLVSFCDSDRPAAACGPVAR